MLEGVHPTLKSGWKAFVLCKGKNRRGERERREEESSMETWLEKQLSKGRGNWIEHLNVTWKKLASGGRSNGG